MPASVENLFPLTSVATSAGPNRPRTISAPRHHGHSAGSEPDPNDATASQPHSHPQQTPKPILNNMPASVENLFPLISVATPCGNNRNLQQENHSNFIVAYPPPTSWHQGDTMTSGAACSIPGAIQLHCRFQIRTGPSRWDGMRRPGCRSFQPRTGPRPVTLSD